jgi:uncharacterized protein (TIGR03435 family)
LTKGAQTGLDGTSKFCPLLRISIVLSILPALALAFPSPYGTEARAQDAASPLPALEVASIKEDKSAASVVGLEFRPDGLAATNVSLAYLIEQAYRVDENRIIGISGPLDSKRYDIEAKVDSSEAPRLKDLTPKQRLRILQPLLADRFQLKLHYETRERPVYALVIAKNGPKLHDAKAGDTYSDGGKTPEGYGAPGLVLMQRDQITFQRVPISGLTSMLAQRLGRNVIDKTGLTGKYDFTMQWPREDDPGPVFNNGQQENAAESAQASIFTIIQEQLGLKLESRKAPVEVLVVDHVEAPSAN